MALEISPLSPSGQTPSQNSRPALHSPELSQEAAPSPEAEPRQEPPSSSEPEPQAAPPAKEPGEAESKEKAAEEQRRVDARQAYALRKKERELSEREAAIKAKEEAAQARPAAPDLSKLGVADVLTEYAKARGVSADYALRELLAHYTNNGQPTPEMVKEREDAEKRELRERLERLEAERKADLEARQAAEENYAAETILHEIRGGFDSTLGGDDSPYPYLQTYERGAVIEEAMRVANEYAEETGEMPAYNDVLEFLEQQEAQRFEARAQKVGWQRAQQERVAPEELAQPPQTPQRAANGTFLPRAATNQQVAQRGAAPTDYSRIPERERFKLVGREVFGF